MNEKDSFSRRATGRSNTAERPPHEAPGAVSIFVLVISALGAAGGALTGYVVGAALENRRVLAIAAAFCGVALAHIARRFLGRELPSYFLATHGLRFPRALIINVSISTIIGGLAGHDLSLVFGATSGPIIGFASGVLSTLLMSMLMAVYFHRHPDERVEF